MGPRGRRRVCGRRGRGELGARRPPLRWRARCAQGTCGETVSVASTCPPLDDETHRTAGRPCCAEPLLFFVMIEVGSASPRRAAPWRAHRGAYSNEAVRTTVTLELEAKKKKPRSV